MQFGRERLWHEFRVAMPPSAGIPRFDQRADVTGIGVVALSLVLGRPLTADEYPRALPDLLNEARERTALGDEQPLSPPLKSWLARALQLDIRRAFASAPEALAALEELTGEGSTYVAAPVALETFLSRYVDAVLQPAHRIRTDGGGDADRGSAVDLGRRESGRPDCAEGGRAFQQEAAR